MKIKEVIKEIPEYIQYKRKERQLEKLNKNIEMMTLDEIAIELNSKLSKINKLNEIDSRTEELINYLLKMNHGNNVDNMVLNILGLLKRDDLKLEFLDRYADKFNDSILKEMIYGRYSEFYDKKINDDVQVRRERRINNIKIKINNITSKVAKKEVESENEFSGVFGKRYINPLELKLRWDEQNRLEKENRELKDKVIAKVFSKNYERLNVYTFLADLHYSLIEKFYDEIPEDIKGTFMLEYLRVDKYKHFTPEEQEKVEQILLESVPMDTLKNEIIQNLENGDEFYSELNKKVKINFSDIQDYYRKTGHYPYLYGFDEDIEIEIKTADELIAELQYFKEDERKNFFNRVKYNLSEEELSKLLESDEIEDDLKSDIYRKMLFGKSNDEKLEIYEKLLLNSKDEKTKNDYKISMAKIVGNYDEILEIIKSGEYNYVHLYSENVLLEFSDEQLKEIYDITEDYDLRRQLLTLTRREKSFSLDEEDEQQDDEEIDEFILVNKQNYVDFIKNAKSYAEIAKLLSHGFENYRSEVAFEQILELYQEFCQKELKNVDNSIIFKQKENCIYNFKRWIANDLTIENYFKLLDTDYPKKDLTRLLGICKFKQNLKIEDVRAYIQDINKIQDLSLKEEILDRITEVYLSKPYFTENQDENKQYENRVANLENLYDELLDSNDIDLSNKYFLLSNYMKMSYYNLYGDDREEKFIPKFTAKFKRLNEMAGKNEYTEIFDFRPIYRESQLLGREINIKNYNNMIECIKYLNSDIVYNKLRNLYSQNHSVAQHISPAMLDDSVIQLLDDDIIEFVSRYGVDTSYFNKLLEDENKTNLFIKTYDRLKNIKAYSEEDSLKIAKFIETLNPADFLKDEAIDEKNIDLIISISSSEKLKNKFSKIKINEGENKFEKYIKNIKEETDKEIHSPLLTRMQALDAIGTRFFGLSYDEMQDFVNKYTVDLDEMLNKYKTKEENAELTLEEQNELKTLRTLRNLKEILAIKDKKALVETFEELDKLEEFEDIDFALANVLEENARRAYAKDYKEKIYNLSEEDLKGKVDGIDIYSPKEFNMLVHVVAAFGDFKLIDKEHPEKSAKEFWKNVDDKQNHIVCTSYIGNSNMCYKRKMEGEKESEEEVNVIFGFSNFNKNSVLMAAPYDIGSDTTSMKSNQSGLQSRFRTAENMLKYTRWNHNEICLERRLENQKETNIEPDYIVCFDEINKESKKVAKDFGIPIVFIDTEQVAKNESEKLEGLFKEFYETKNASKISEILNRYQTNLNSFSDFRTELVEEYFNPSKMNEKIERLIQWIDREYKIGNTENAIKCYQALSEAFQNEINLNLESGIDPEYNTKGEFKIREFNCLARQKYEKVQHNSDSYTRTTEERSFEQKGNEGKAFEVISKMKERNQNNGR